MSRRGRTRQTEHLLLHAAGTGELAAAALAATVPDAVIGHRDESAIVFGSATAVRSADTLPFAGNVFVLRAVTQRRRDLAASVRRLVEQVPAAGLPRNRQGFRVMVHLDGTLAPLDRGVRTELERALGRATGGRVVSRGSVGEYWVLGRTGATELWLAERLPRTGSRDGPKGSLAPDLAAMIVAASRPDRRDRVLDPFAGSGALLLARAASPFRRLLAGELDPDRRVVLAERLRGTAAEVTGDDARALSLPDGEVDVVLTDPPWGEHDELDQPYGEFVSAVAPELARVLHPRHGRLVLLASRRSAPTWRSALATAGLTLADDVEILVHGHPASVVRGVLRGSPRMDR